MFKLSSIGLKYLFFLVLLSFATGSIRIEAILQHIGPDYKNIVRASSYISLLIGGLMSFIVLLFSFYITTLVQPERYKSETVPYFTYGIQYFAIVLMAVELAKVALVFIFLRNELDGVDVKDLSRELLQTKWYKAQSVFNLLGIAAGAYIFADTVRNKSGQAKDIKGLLLLALPPIVLLTVALLVQF
jgi:hypothetical protein